MNRYGNTPYGGFTNGGRSMYGLLAPRELLSFWSEKAKEGASAVASVFAEEEETDPLSLWAQQKGSIPAGIYAGGGGYYYQVDEANLIYLQRYTITGNWRRVTDKTAEAAIRNAIANKTKLTQTQLAAIRATPAPTTTDPALPGEVMTSGVIKKVAGMPPWVVPVVLVGAVSLLLLKWAKPKGRRTARANRRRR